MSLFAKKDEHAGSGLDKPDPKTLAEKLSGALKAVIPPTEPKPQPAPVPPAD